MQPNVNRWVHSWNAWGW